MRKIHPLVLNGEYSIVLGARATDYFMYVAFLDGLCNEYTC
jgi:hypothetical protein